MVMLDSRVRLNDDDDGFVNTVLNRAHCTAPLINATIGSQNLKRSARLCQFQHASEPSSTTRAGLSVEEMLMIPLVVGVICWVSKVGPRC